ncbi:hypothetical protein K2X30_12765 [bacterium]|nr:hypothetical protein [bacterium]
MRLKIVVSLVVLLGIPKVSQACQDFQEALSEVYYQASFQAPQNKHGLKIQVGKTASKKRGKAKLLARISSDRSQCVAICQVKGLQTDLEARRRGVFTPISLDLTCVDPETGFLNSPASILFKNTALGVYRPTLRMGTWLNGFQQTTLKVERDRYSLPTVRPQHGG